MTAVRTGRVATLAVAGNISRDHAVHADGRTHDFVGGAGLNVAVAAARAGCRAAPLAVVGVDLEWITRDERLSLLDWSCVQIRSEASCTFTMSYDFDGGLTDVACEYGVSAGLTEHVLSQVGGHDHHHVCCRRPLQVREVLARLAERQYSFSVDFYLASASELIRQAVPFLPVARVVFVNADEFAILTAEIDVRALTCVVISDGPRAARVLRHGISVAEVVPEACLAVEVTGAGDELTGCFLSHLLAGADETESLRRAVAAARRAITEPREIPLSGTDMRE